MKAVLAVFVIVSLSLGCVAQAGQPVARNTSPPQGAPQPRGADLNTILADLQRATLATNADLSKLRIEKWKTDNSQKQEMQQVAESLQRNITKAVPALISDVQNTPGSVAKAFKLYHNINVVYEFLNSLSEAAGTFGKKEEYEPLANDATSLNSARQQLSDYIDQVATTMENQLKKPAPTPAKNNSSAQTTQGPKKIVIDDSPSPTKKKKKTASTPPPSQ